MNTRNMINPITRALPVAAMQQTLIQAATAGLVGLGLRRRRRETPVFAIATGIVLAAAAAAALINPSSRRSIRSLLERTGGGIGKQVGKVLGEYAGAHPVRTAEIGRKAREFVGASDPATS